MNVSRISGRKMTLALSWLRRLGIAEMQFEFRDC